jgi:hypothetical protein
MAETREACDEADGAAAPGPLFKTTIVIWSEYPGEKVDLEHLARDATCGDAYCSRYRSERVGEPEGDPAWDGTDFFAERGN